MTPMPDNRRHSLALKWLEQNYSQLETTTEMDTDEERWFWVYKKGEDVIFDYDIETNDLIIRDWSIRMELGGLFDLSLIEVIDMVREFISGNYREMKPDHIYFSTV